MHVSTPVDPSSSPKNETVYAFLWRCIKYSWIGVYEDEKKVGKNIITNYAVLSILSTVAFALFVYLVFGMQCMIIHSVMAFGSIIYLEATNYIEHYGL
jgi:alkane 1-monooxygenase